MIGRLRGTVVSEELDGLALVDVGGVGYEVLTPAGSLGRARGADDQVVLFVHTHVREDSLDLFGFPTEIEKRVFRVLIGVPNVGPKTALGVLAELPPVELARAVESGDLARLNRVSGIGKKTAQRLVLELKEKLAQLGIDGAEGTDVPTDQGSGGKDARLLGALTNMGYKPGEAERAVAALGYDPVGVPLQQSLKDALALLAR